MPPAPRTDDDALLDALVEVFRDRGYEGASLSRISEATGLQRASLYHRFPGGKDEMVEAALRRVTERFGPLVVEPLTGDDPPAQRIRTMCANLSRFYDGGRKSCLLDTLSVGPPDDPLRPAVRASMARWQEAMERVARDAGLPAPTAKVRAEEALIRIEGALIVARVRGATRPFTRTLESLTELLTTP